MTEKSKEKKKVKTLTKERVDLQELSKILSGGLSVAGQSAVRTDARRKVTGAQQYGMPRMGFYTAKS
jgi:hypothetical protein